MTRRIFAATWDHPRIRGEHVQMNRAIADGSGSSPHTRGAPGTNRAESSTSWDHPRIRGEHSTSWVSTAKTMGSSPHTRGALLCADAFRRVPGIIPAYAGSTP